MPKGQLPTVKVSVCNTFLSEIDSNCNLIVRPGDISGVIMKSPNKVNR